MKKNIKNFYLAGSLILTIFAFGGCVALAVGAAAGAGGYAYIKGALEKNVDYSLEQSHRAALAALKDLKMEIKEDTLNINDAQVTARGKDKESISVVIESLTERSSKIKVRVGVFGDQDKSQVILNAIQKRL